MAKCFQCGGEHTGTYSCLPPEAPVLTNLVSRLRDEAKEQEADWVGTFYKPELLVEAADEVERLRAELAIVTRDRDTLLEMSGHTLEQVARRIEKLRRGVHE